MKSSLAVSLALLFASLFIFLSCNKDDDQPNPKPVITLITPKGEVAAGEDIEVKLQFKDDNGLKEVEIRIGNLNVTGNVYSLVQRGLSGIADNLEYSVTVPHGLNVIGTNYIYVSCIDIDGNETILDMDFEITDKTPPNLNIIYFDDIDVFDGGSGKAWVEYEFSDEGGVGFTTVELWKTDGNGNLMTLIKEDDINYQTPISQTTVRTVGIGTAWSSGTNYRFIVKVEDVNGNVAEEPINILLAP